MSYLKFLVKATVILTACIVVSGCSVVNYSASMPNKPSPSVNVKKNYRIASVESVTIDTMKPERRLKEQEVMLLSTALNNRPGHDFETGWKKAVGDLTKIPGFQNAVSTNLTTWKLYTRSIAPNLFSITNGTPVNVRAVMFIRPARLNPWWALAYPLTGFVLAPLQKRSLGGAVVSVLDQHGQTLDTKTIIFQRSYYFSTLFPFALFAAGRFSVKAAGTTPMLDEQNIRTQLMAYVLAEILKRQTPADNKEWRNIRSATVEAIAGDSNDAALKLIKTAVKHNLGGNESKEFLKILD